MLRDCDLACYTAVASTTQHAGGGKRFRAMDTTGKKQMIGVAVDVLLPALAPAPLPLVVVVVTAAVDIPVTNSRVRPSAVAAAGARPLHYRR